MDGFLHRVRNFFGKDARCLAHLRTREQLHEYYEDVLESAVLLLFYANSSLRDEGITPDEYTSELLLAKRNLYYRTASRIPGTRQTYMIVNMGEDSFLIHAASGTSLNRDSGIQNIEFNIRTREVILKKTNATEESLALEHIQEAMQGVNVPWKPEE